MIKNFKNKTIALFVAVLLLASTLTMLTASTPSNAQDTMTAKNKAYISVRPTLIGLGQELLINMWVSPAPGAQRQYKDLKVVIAKPDGSVQEIPGIDTYVADGTMWMTWYPDQVGDWTFRMDFPGQNFPAGIYFNGNYYEKMEDVPPPLDGVAGSYSNNEAVVHATSIIAPPASSTTITVHVQEEMVHSWPEAQPPTDYWTRPVDEINRDWWPYVGSYPWFGPAKDDPLWDQFYPNTNPMYNDAYGFVPWVTGPESAHIAWKRPYSLGGLMGGDWGLPSYAAGSGGELKPQLIVMGRGYHAFTKASENGRSQTYWQCYDIRTGEVFWERPLASGETAPNVIEWSAGTVSVEGAAPKPTAPTLLSMSNGYLRKYNAFTGAMALNVSIAPFMTNAIGAGNVPSTSCIYYKNGYCLGVQDLGANAGSERYRLINWTTLGSDTNFANRVVSNTTYARATLPSEFLIDWNVGLGATITSIRQGDMIVAMNISGFDLATGNRLWTKMVDAPQYSGSAQVSDHGKLVVVSSNGRILAFDLRTGNDAWQTRVLDEPWDSTGFGSYSMMSVYGNLYWFAQSGIYSVDWATGNINWKFEKEAPPFETPYTGSEGQTIWPFLSPGLLVDGKIYAPSNKHSPEQPFYRSSPTVCIDAFTGEEVWSVAIPGSSALWRRDIKTAIADGYMTLGARDGYMYVFGKGQSETTVSASQVPLTVGQKALITGTVIDLSPAQPGAPCVSKESVAAQMEQYHLGAPIGGVLGDVMLVGVPVSLDVLDPNGNYYNIGVVASDGYSGTFGFDDWAPSVAGKYTITATFMGDESYGSSFATTYLTVAEGAGVESADNTVLYAVIGGTIAIIVVMVVCFLLFRKK